MSVELDDITCRELVELVNDYIEGALSDADRARFEAHLGICEACVTYVDQIRMTIGASGRLTEEQLDPQARDELLSAFRGWKRP